MELFFVVVIAAFLGLGVRYAFPGRDTYGAALLPAVAVGVASVVWVGLLWAGLTFDGGWIWVATLVVSVVASVLLALRIPRLRRGSDKRMLAKLSGTAVS
jgi:hypothetical protein